MQNSQLEIITWNNLELLISGSASFVENVCINLGCFIKFNQQMNELCFEMNTLSEKLPRNLPSELKFRVITDEGRSRLIISCMASELYRNFYDFGCEVLEMVLAKTHLPHEAVDEAWTKWGRLIDRQTVLSYEKQVGLIGELWTLRRVADSRGWATALESWHLNANAEHDFGLEDFDLEVKSTTSESRTHMIGSLTQLLPSPGRDLYLLSIQLTSAANNAKNSFTLSSCVLAIFAQLANLDVLQAQFSQRLAQAGWKQEHMHLYDTSFIARSNPFLIHVDQNCPRLVVDLLKSMPANLLNRIESVAYRIKVDGLGVEDGTSKFLGILP